MMMTEEKKNECVAPTDTLTFELPCQIIERIEKYAQKNGGYCEWSTAGSFGYFFAESEII